MLKKKFKATFDNTKPDMNVNPKYNYYNIPVQIPPAIIAYCDKNMTHKGIFISLL